MPNAQLTAVASLLASLVATSMVTAAPQGGGGIGHGIPPHLAPRMTYPADPAIAQFDPIVDPVTGAPDRHPIAAAGAVDLDGDGTREAWFLAGVGTQFGQFAIHMGRGSDLGRFRAYPGVVTSPLTPSWTDGCSYESAHAGMPRLLVVSPIVPTIQRVEFRSLAAVGQHPRENVEWNLAATPFFASGGGTYEIEAADHAGDGYPDIYTLTQTTLQTGPGTTVRREHVPSTGAPLTLDLPGACDHLRIGDFNGDGATDFAVHLPGVGIAAFLDAGTHFAFCGGVPLPAGMLEDLVVGDLEADGRDELCVVLAEGVLVYPMLGTTPGAAAFHYIPHAVARSMHIGPLATAAIVDAYGTAGRELVMLPRDAAGFGIHPYDAVGGNFLPAIPFKPASQDAAAYAGTGVDGQGAVTADLDGDGDLDLLLQAANGRWWSMSGPAQNLRPLAVQNTGSSGPDAFGRIFDHFAVTLPPSWASAPPGGGPAGTTELEIAMYSQVPGSPDYVVHHAEVSPIGPTGVVPFSTVIHTLLPTAPAGSLETTTSALLSIHLRNGNQRFASQLLWFDGNPTQDGSAVGLRWKLIVIPPLPAIDDDLLPWN